MSEVEFNRKAAKKWAEKNDFSLDETLFCPECGRTIIRTQRTIDPGREDSLFCTCEDFGPPFVPITDND